MEQRLIDLEIRVAYHEATIAELNDVITQQWRKIVELERRLSRLDEDLQALDSAEAHPVTKPPHY